MRHFPILLDLAARRVAVSGGGEAALAKLRLLLRTEARITVFAATPCAAIADLARRGRLTLERRALAAGDARGAALLYAASDDADEDARVAALGRAEGVLVNLVDNLRDSAFLTPAIVDRDPVTVAIGTEGTAPVLARLLKADLEARLPARLGLLARLGGAFRRAARRLPAGRARRAFWSEFYRSAGPRAADRGGAAEVNVALQALLRKHQAAAPPEGHVSFVGAGPGDPELLTLKARRTLDGADVVIHDSLVPPAILELARREALIIEAGKRGFGSATPQAAIHGLMIAHAAAGAQVVRLKGGDPALLARLDEETEALDAAGIAWAVIPGVTAASAAAAAIGRSLTRRGRNSALSLFTAHDMAGFADHDWAALARPGAISAVYMGKAAARFLQGRLMMHGAAPDLPVTVVENASRPDQRVLATRLDRLAPDLAEAAPEGPSLILLGLSPHQAVSHVSYLQQELADHA